MGLKEELIAYVPDHEQELRDKEIMLAYLAEHGDCLERKNKVAHFTVSIWTVNPQRTKALMAYHNIYDAWAWIGGHADGEEDLRKVALRELNEETGVKNARLIGEGIFSLETLTVDGHIKRGEYVPSHLHLNVTYLAEADESEMLTIKPDENSGVMWFDFAEIEAMTAEPWMTEHIYKKLIARCR
jgi:ADP-ribose pyrophosphatase YjhB (NUDIX family)